MIRHMREKMSLIMWLVIIAFIGTIIFSWGMGGIQSNDPRRKGIIAEINGDPVKYEDFKNIQESLFNAEKNRGEIDELKTAELKEKAWNQLVNMTVIGQEIKKNNITVSEEQLYSEIRNNPLPEFQSNPQFMTNNKFDLKKYQDFIDNPQPGMEATFRQIEMIYANRIPSKLLEAKIGASVYVSDEDVVSEYKQKNLKAKAKFVKVGISDFKPADSLITDEEVEKYFNEHKADFGSKKEQRSFDYILFSTEATAKDSAFVLEDITDALKQINEGAKFEEVAAIYSEDGSKDSGGDLGWFGKGRMVPAFEKAAFEAEIGKVVGPIKTRFGYHLIKVVDKKYKNAKKKKEVTEVKASHILIKFKTYPSTIDDAKYLAQNFRDELSMNKKDEASFITVAKKLGVEIKKSKPVNKGDYTAELGRVPGLGEFLFSNEAGVISPMMVSSKGFVYFVIKDIIPEAEKTIEDVRKEIVGKIKTQKALEKSFEVLNKLAPTLKDTVAFTEAAKTDKNITSAYTPEFTRNSYISGVGRDEIFSEKAFNMKPGEISIPFKGTNGSYIICLVSKDEFNQAVFDKEKKVLKEKLEKKMKNEAISTWMKGIVDNAEIKDYRSLYFQ